MLVGRETQSAVLIGLLSAARSGRAGVLQLVGEAGIGKTSLLADVLARAEGFRVLHAVGVREEAGIPDAGLMALLRPLQDLVPFLPAGQAGAIATTLGQDSGPAAGQLVVGAACLQLLALGAERSPVLLLADDCQWWDEKSWRALSFAVRRVAGERLAVVLATRPGMGREVPGVPTVRLTGLDAEGAATLLQGRYPETSDEVCRQLTNRTGGNPLALLEAARGLAAAQRTGTRALPESLPSSDRLQEFFVARVNPLPAPSRHLLLLAALDGRGDLAVLSAAAAHDDVSLRALRPAERAGLVAIGDRVTFAHPLVRAAVLGAAGPADRRAAHAVLAAVLHGDPDRAVWHAAAACEGPDERVARALGEVAERARRVAAPLAASAAYERAAELTVDLAARARRLLLAAEAALSGGATARAEALATALDAELLSGPARGRPALVRGRAAVLLGRPAEAGPLLLAAADGLDARTQAAALGEAVDAALECGDLDFAALLVARAERVQPDGSDPVLRLHVARARAVLLQVTGDLADAGHVLRHSIDALADAPVALADSAAGWLALGTASCDIGDLAAARRRFASAAAHARRHGDLPMLVEALSGQAFAEHALGQWSQAYADGTLGLALMTQDRSPGQLADLLQILAEIDAARGTEDLCRQRCAEVRQIAARFGLRQVAVLADRREALLDLGLSHLEAAANRLERVRRQNDKLGQRHPYLSPVPDLVEAYVRMGRPDDAAALVPEFVAVAGHDAPLTAQARALRTQALVAGPDSYSALFDRSAELDAASGMEFHRARTLLCHGERLRRDRRRVAARRVLRSALELFDGLAAAPWSERVRSELAATGESNLPRSATAAEQLTPQELQIAMLVGAGQRNREIAGTLFLSVRTVEFHLTRVYRKLSVATRSELAAHLARSESAAG